MKLSLFFFLVFLGIFSSCKKKDGNIDPDIIIGEYCVENHKGYVCNMASISKADQNNSDIIVYVCNMGESLNAAIVNYDLVINEHTFEDEVCAHGSGDCYDIIKKTHGNGIIAKDQRSIFFNFYVEIISPWGTSFDTSTCTFYNNSRYDLFGTYTGDYIYEGETYGENTIVISDLGDSINLSIIYDDGTRYGWEDLKGTSGNCNIECQLQRVMEVSSGDYQNISVGGTRTGNKISLTTRHYTDSGFRQWTYEAEKRDD